MSKYNTLITSSLTDEKLQEECFDESLENFIQDRLANYEKTPAYKIYYNKLDEMFDISPNDEAVHTLVGLQSAVAHSNYIKGFAEGMKFALTAEKL